MLRKLWATLSTRIRPDSASLHPFVGFDTESGSFTIKFEAELRGAKILLNRAHLTQGVGFKGNRKFKLPRYYTKRFRAMLAECQWPNDSTAKFEQAVGNIDRAREFGSTIRALKKRCAVDLAPEAELLIRALAWGQAQAWGQTSSAGMGSDFYK